MTMTAPAATDTAAPAVPDRCGRVTVWGDDSVGQLGGGGTDLPDAVSAVDAGSGHVLALTPDGSVYGWGRNAFGQLGDGSTENRDRPVAVRGLPPARLVAAGGGHSVAVLTDGSVWAWGAGFFGALGPDTDDLRTTPAPVPGLPPAVAVAAGRGHTLILTADGAVWSWGRDDWGQLGDGTLTCGRGGRPGRTELCWLSRNFPARPEPAPVNGLPPVERLAAGGGHSLAATADGALYAWGCNDRGQLGLGSRADQTAPTRVAGLDPVVAAAGGYHHSVVATADGTVHAWGLNDGGQLGDGGTEDRSTPDRVPGLDRIVAVAANGGGTGAQPGSGGHSLALREDGSVYAWGWNTAGQLGDGSTRNRLVPVRVLDLAGATAIAAGGEVARRNRFEANPSGAFSLALH